MHECKDCTLNEGDCGHHFSMNGITNYTIPSQTACDQFDCCMFFKPKKYETMTNKEAIEILTNVKNTPQITWTNGVDVAFDLAIKALENEQPCKSCGVPVFTANCYLVCPFKKYKEVEDDRS